MTVLMPLIKVKNNKYISLREKVKVNFFKFNIEIINFFYNKKCCMIIASIKY